MERTISAPLLACAACRQEMQCDDDHTLPLHEPTPDIRSPGTPICIGSYGVGQPSRSGPMIVAPFVPSEIDERAALEALDSPKCWGCGHKKGKGCALCIPCRHELAQAVPGTPEVWLSLYKAVGQGLESALANALTILRERREAETVPLIVAAEKLECSPPASPSIAQ